MASMHKKAAIRTIRRTVTIRSLTRMTGSLGCGSKVPRLVLKPLVSNGGV